ncbi:SPFH domain-containing protein [Urbifossiella limnaea]|uniref:Protein HflC n=1 Tax=Urbifossiella limnaea TaxID=2528023 RepID=A0A517XNM4_9BACT|nr:SPFH domain-containing protein [Urbifossiella limnaea]QDU19115.1 Modulator of FtsH protease HflC [Urbifossiella limnaea]
MKRVLQIAAAVAVVLWLRTAFYAVDYAEFAYVTQFGERVAVHDGETAAGLKVKAPWPVHSVVRIDRRVQSFDLPAVESLTRDPVTKTVDKTLAVDAFVTWRIPSAEAAEQFVKAIRTPEQARKTLGPQVSGRLAALVSTMPLDDLISVADAATIDARAEKVRAQLLGDGFRERALAEYGVEVIDVRVRRFSYPEAVRASIADRIRSERAKKAADYESEGRQRAAKITTDAYATAKTTEDDAAAQKTRIEGEAKAEAARVRGAAYAQDREFGQFLDKLQAFQVMVADTRDVLLLSTRHPLFDLLRGPPGAVAPPKQ